MLDHIGQILRTNHVTIGPDFVEKRYKDLAVSMVWGVLERKPYMNAAARYNREKGLVQALQHSGLNVPEPLSFDDSRKVARWRRLDLESMVDFLGRADICGDEKIQAVRDCMELLHAVHNFWPHGDAYMKNFFRILPGQTRVGVYTCDFEYDRNSPDKYATDVMMLAANAVKLTGKTADVLLAVSEVYGEVRFPFDKRDILFFRLRFGMGSEFFSHFSSQYL